MYNRMPSGVLLLGHLTVAGAVILTGPDRALLAQEPAPLPEATLLPAASTEFAHDTDSNSPAVWALVEGRPVLHVFNSTAGWTARSAGRTVNRLQTVGPIAWTNAGPLGGTWMEAIVGDVDDTWYGFYHNELAGTVCPDTEKVVAQIGAARSNDRGATWHNLGPVLELPASLARCVTANHYFVGGAGDFSVALDRDHQYLYLLYTQYVEQDGGVGVSAARMPWALRDTPRGALAVWNDGAWLPAQRLDIEDDVPDAEALTVDAWSYPVATPFHAAPNRWDDDRLGVDVFWGPAVHWNTHLELWVMLLNRAQSNEWDQEGVYVSYNAALDDPGAWSTPIKLLSGGRWYPQVIGIEPNAGTDKEAGQVARFFMGGRSDYTIRFRRP